MRDLILAGGGLANGLIALALKEERPEVDFVLIEKDAQLGGNHTWSFHQRDLSPWGHRLVAPLVGRSWQRQEVRFPGLVRTIDLGYHSIQSSKYHDVISKELGERILLGCGVTRLDSREVELEDGRSMEAASVIDGRGWLNGVPFPSAYQKFLGQVLELEEPHGLADPVLMDATVDQSDGYRFVYLLPWTPRSLLVEETDYSEIPELDLPARRARISKYTSDQGWVVKRISREERGALPIPLGGEPETIWPDDPAQIPRSGVRAGLFHPTTGYSLPDAVALAERLAGWRLESDSLYRGIRRHALKTWRRRGFFRLLNRMLFLAADPPDRFRVFKRFYGLPDPLIARFYADRLRWTDRLRFVSGRPPVSIRRALPCLFEKRPAPGLRTKGEETTDRPPQRVP